MAAIDLENIGLTYPGGGGVSKVELHIADGEYVALLGPSGSGKTTLLNLVAGFIAPDSGTIRIASKTVADGKTHTPPEKRNLGMVFQQHAVWPHMSVAKNVEYPLRKSGVAASERRGRVNEILELVGLSEYSNRPPDTLSGGQRQRVALARALAGSPAALLLDEPFASLDAALKERLRVELDSLASRTGATVLHVTHDREEALGLADRVVVMRDGRVEQIAPPRELLAVPATPFVANFVSDASLIPVRVEGQRLLDESGIEVPVENVERRDGVGDTGVLAVLPKDVSVERGDEAEVKAALYGGDGMRLYLDWRGSELRAVTRADTPLGTGDAVKPIIHRGTFFSGE